MTALRNELLDALSRHGAAPALRDLDRRGKLVEALPELDAGRGFTQPERHYYDVLDHNLAAVAAMDASTGEGDDGAELREVLSWLDFPEALSREIDGLPMMTLLRLAALVHDVGKPSSAIIRDGALKFPRHGPLGAELLRERLPELGFSPAVTDFIARMVRYHLRPSELVKGWPPTDHAVRKFVTDLDGHVLPLMLVNLADGMATRGPGYTRENFRMHCGLVNYVTARAWAITQPGEPSLVTGEELMTALDLEGGRLLGAVLTSVRQAQLRGEVTDRDSALTLAREIFASLRG